MERLTITLPPEQKEYLTEISKDDGEYDNRSDAVRKIIQTERQKDDLQDRIEELNQRIEQKQDRIEQLENQLRKRSNIEKKIEDLPAKIEDSMSYNERRQQMLDQASVGERLKWKITGVPVSED